MSDSQRDISAVEADCLKDSSPPSKAGQLIGNAFEAAVVDFIRDYLNNKYSDYELLEADGDGSTVRLSMLGGLTRQMDNVISKKGSSDPIALMETKWLKDARHHNDKGAWILQLREVRKNYPTVRGAVAVLAGYWTSGVGVMLMNEGGVRMVLTATDEQVYSTLQPEVDAYFGEDTFELDARKMRQRYIRPEDFRSVLCHLYATGRLGEIAKTWLHFSQDGTTQTGMELVRSALDELLSSPPENPKPQKMSVTFEIETGNIIHGEFDDVEEMMVFINRYAGNPKAILEAITPKPYPKQDNQQDSE